MADHIERINLFAFLMTVALFTSPANAADQCDSMEIPPAPGYPQAVFSPQAFSIQLRRKLQNQPSSAPISSTPVAVEYAPPPQPSSPSPSIFPPDGSPQPPEDESPSSPPPYSDRSTASIDRRTASKDSIAIPPDGSYTSAIFSPPSPQAFSIQLLARRLSRTRRELQAWPNASPGFSPKTASPSSYPPPSPSRKPPLTSPSSRTPTLSASSPQAHGDLVNGSDGKTTPIAIIVGAVVAVIVVVALIGVAVAWKCKKKPAAKGDDGQAGVCDDSETTERSPEEGSAFLPVKVAMAAYLMKAHQAAAKAYNGVAREKTTSAAKESGSHAASLAPGRTADRMALTALAARHFSYNEILSITGNYGLVIGEGGSSTVYYGQLQEGGLKVAVKKLTDSGSQSGNLLAELKILMRIHHKNLVSLVGLCEEQGEIILVSEYMANGSLFEILKARTSELTWRKRLQIALGAATGLEYLHTGCKPAVIHRDIKSTNILLDENLEAKLADFGLSKAGALDGSECSAYQTKVAGTLGYIDPEYLYTQTLTKKSDVYSFGVVLFELITGKSAVVMSETNEKLHLTNWVMSSIMRGEIETVLDPMLKGNCNIESVWEVAAIARAATEQPSGRPDMPDIVSTLKAALGMETSWVDTASASEIISRQPSFREDPHNPAAR